MRKFREVMESIWPRCATSKQMTDWLVKLIEPRVVFELGTGRDFEALTAKWTLYAPLLAEGTIVCVDDVDFTETDAHVQYAEFDSEGCTRRDEWKTVSGDRRTREFWEALPYDKVVAGLGEHGFGVFLYERGKA